MFLNDLKHILFLQFLVIGQHIEWYDKSVISSYRLIIYWALLSTAKPQLTFPSARMPSPKRRNTTKAYRLVQMKIFFFFHYQHINSFIIYYSTCWKIIDSLPLSLSLPCSFSPHISEVNRGRSKVNKPSRRSSFTQQPNVKGQRAQGVITRLPACVCVVSWLFFFSFCEMSFKLNKNSEYLMLEHKDPYQDVSLCVCLKTWQLLQFQPSMENCLPSSK